MSDKAPITHEDLPHIAAIEKMMDRGGPGVPAGQWNDLVEFVKHLRITAEADRPPLPEGWYLWDNGRAVYFDGERSAYTNSTKDTLFSPVSRGDRVRLTPIRPTITREVLFDATGVAIHEHEKAPHGSKMTRAVEAAFRAAGIEVSQS